MPYPLPNVRITRLAAIPPVATPLYMSEGMEVNLRECRLLIPGAGVFYALEGRELWYAPEPGAAEGWVRTQLQGLPLAALLHQRGVLHFHAAAFLLHGQGVMLLGQSGAGKSSLTAAFHLAGATALSDDLSAMVFENGSAMIWPIDREIRLRQNALEQLPLRPEHVEGPDPFTGKFALKTPPGQLGRIGLHHLLHLEKHSGSDIIIEQPPAEVQFGLLRSEICHWEMLRGMPGTEQAYLSKILQILNTTPLLRILRPENCSIDKLHNTIADFLQNQKQRTI